uniref:Uncharacterized protein n=1 Tax=Hyaloperonospora arabidopsidis (strain Emoy2) TaxID=559515 RepID=M4BTX9_HYAAE
MSKLTRIILMQRDQPCLRASSVCSHNNVHLWSILSLSRACFTIGTCLSALSTCKVHLTALLTRHTQISTI